METQFKKWGEKDVEVVGSVGSFGWTTDSWLCFFTVILSKNPTTAERVRGRRDAQVAADSCTSAADIVHLRLFITVGKQGSVTGIIYVPPVHAGLGKSALWCLFFCFLKSLAVRWLLTLPPYKITHHTVFIKEGKSRKKTKTSLYPALFYYFYLFGTSVSAPFFRPRGCHLTQTGTETEATDTLELQHLCYGQKLKQCYLENCGCWVK